MAYLLSSERPAAVAFSSTILAGFLGWLGKLRTQRAQKVALSTLLDYDEHRLDDLGLSRQDVVEAILHPRIPAGNTLAARRAARAAVVRSNAASTALFEAGGGY
jgi:uncharacterized protein YjiS (DUF1127 family)